VEQRFCDCSFEHCFSIFRAESHGQRQKKDLSFCFVILCVSSTKYQELACLKYFIILTKYINWHLTNKEFSKFLSFKNISKPGKKAYKSLRLRNAGIENDKVVGDQNNEHLHELNCIELNVYFDFSFAQTRTLV